MFGEQSRKENKVVKVKLVWHGLAEEGKMLFIEYLLWAAKSVNSLALSLYGPTLICIHDHWKNHSFDCDGPLLAK